MKNKDKEDSSIYQGFAPRQDRVLVRIDEVEMRTPGGLIIPTFDGEGKATSAAEKPNRGTVIAIGPKVDDLEIGNRVLYGLHSGFTVNHMGTEYRLIRASDAFAQINQ
jgi:chaperonin GroES